MPLSPTPWDGDFQPLHIPKRCVCSGGLWGLQLLLGNFAARGCACRYRLCSQLRGGKCGAVLCCAGHLRTALGSFLSAFSFGPAGEQRAPGGYFLKVPRASPELERAYSEGCVWGSSKHWAAEQAQLWDFRASCPCSLVSLGPHVGP